MRNFQEIIKARTNQLAKTSKSSFNTNDFLLEVLLNQKRERADVINLIIEKRLSLKGVNINTTPIEELNEMIDKLFKTSKNGLDTSVSDSNNNSSFSYNETYSNYTLVKTGSKLEIVAKEVIELAKVAKNVK